MTADVSGAGRRVGNHNPGVLRPRTRPGRWSIMLIVAFGVLLGLFFLAVAVGERGGDAFFDNLWLALPMLAAWLAGAGATATGAFAIISRRERGALVFGATLLGLLVTAFGVAEVLFPH
ncbi:MAG: hypothetical protein GY724_05965 [Actinomycetia bacterium]|nr:hypothetical protein [Actinomycetes bacterium]MCP4226661.1 hypothetical protein [Actinomycetes bacterium]MCP5031243.1 hypothetical protein [Actinomycetes bacterium]